MTASELIALADELDGWHDCADGDVNAGNGHFRLQCISDSDQQRLNLRAALREASKALRPAATPPAQPAPAATPGKPDGAVRALRDNAAFQNTDGADAATVLAAVRHCASSWEGEARLLGNVRAKDIVRAIDALVRPDETEALRLLAAEDERQSKLHDLLETIREQIRLEVPVEHRPAGLFKNIQDAVYTMRGRTPLMNDAAVTAAHSPKIAAAETSPGTAPQITMADIRARVGDGMVSSDDVIEAANTLLRKHWEAETGPGDNYSKEIERQIMEVADMIAATLDQPSDPRAWDHLLVYAPRDALERRLSTLNPGEYDDTVLALNRTDDEVRQRHVDRGGFEPGNSDQVENEPSRNAPLRMEVSNCGTQGVIAAIDRLDVKAEAKSQEPDAMAIKPLEWSDNEGDGVQVADAVTGEYRVRCHGGEFWVVARDGIPLSSRPYELASFAKAAAQADYEQRIRSTLIHPMTKPEAPASTSSLSRG